MILWAHTTHNTSWRGSGVERSAGGEASKRANRGARAANSSRRLEFELGICQPICVEWSQKTKNNRKDKRQKTADTCRRAATQSAYDTCGRAMGWYGRHTQFCFEKDDHSSIFLCSAIRSPFEPWQTICINYMESRDNQPPLDYFADTYLGIPEFRDPAFDTGGYAAIQTHIEEYGVHFGRYWSRIFKCAYRQTKTSQ